jgi:hypothetical protein
MSLSSVMISPEEAWQYALNQLQLQMSRNYFDTWVRPTKLLSVEKNVFTIGTQDQYTKAWLESRLATTLKRLLSGVFEKDMIIQFEVLPECVDISERKFDDSEKLNNFRNSWNDIDPKDLHEMLQNALVMPERVVRIPVYLFRWLPYVGAESIFLMVAIGQEQYLFTGGNFSWASCTVSTRAERICQWAGISRARFFRLIQPGSPLEWFIRKSSGEHELNPKTGRFRKTPNKYFLPGIPITPGDAEDLKSFLLNQKNENPKAALKIALDTPLNKILRFPMRHPTEGFRNTLPHLVTIHDVIQNVFDDKADSEMDQLAIDLGNHLTRPENFVTVSWYFLKNWLSILGVNAAMFILLLRKSCFFNQETGEFRNTLWVEGGYQAIADWLGIGNPRNISNWFPSAINRGKHRSHYTDRTTQEFARQQKIRDLLTLFVERINYRGNKNASYAWQFKVQYNDPVIPSHRPVVEMAEFLIRNAVENDFFDEFLSWVEGLNLNDSRNLKDESMLEWIHSNMMIDCPETFKQHFIDCINTFGGSNNDCLETILKILKSFKDSYCKEKILPNENNLRVISDNYPENKGRRERKELAKWDLEQLLSRVSKINREKILEQESDAHSFVSWLLHASSNPFIRNPYNLAISKVKEFPKQGAGGACDKLAALPPSQLVDLIAFDLETEFYGIHSGSSSLKKDWRMLFGEGKQNRVRLLADALNIQIGEPAESCLDN